MVVKTTIICGDRYWNDVLTIDRFLQSLSLDTRIVEGGCRGADEITRWRARLRGFTVITEKADWFWLGKRAGPIRNQRMLDLYHPDQVVGFHNDIEHSKGTKDMIDRANMQGYKTMVITSKGDVIKFSQKPYPK